MAFKNMEIAQKAMDEKLIPLMQEENALVMEYNQLIAGAKIDYNFVFVQSITIRKRGSVLNGTKFHEAPPPYPILYGISRIRQ